MKIRFIKEDSLLMIKSNITYICEQIIKNDDTDINKLFPNDTLISESNKNFPKFNLITADGGNVASTDFENVKIVYGAWRELPDSIAADERMWVAYTMVEDYSYMKTRWEIKNPNDFQNRYLFGYSQQRSLFRNGIARLWWIGRLTYDDSRKDPFELTKFLVAKDQDYIESICGRNVFNNPEIVKATVAALIDFETEGNEINRKTVREISKYMNLLAGTYLIDFMSYKELYEKAKQKILLVSESNEV